MNRVNFARCSGVIVDVCRGHGTWFDRDELSGIVQFIRGGGLEWRGRKKSKRLSSNASNCAPSKWSRPARESGSLGLSYSDEERLGGISAAGSLLKFLLK